MTLKRVDNMLVLGKSIFILAVLQHLMAFGEYSNMNVNGQDWQPRTHTFATQPHDEDAPDPIARKHYFSPNHFYCVETACAPCGVVLAWTKFAKAESPTNILQFLATTFPTPQSRPDYICIDKACQVMCTSLINGSWNTTWKHTSHFIVDSYHYNNHQADDRLCCTWCNPSPSDNSAPNLVGEHIND